ncbi:autophagy-related protein 22-like protein [Russula vinacea]|nr:autophagy-related protein 22-like protein [Russula vinacea]
MSRFPWSSKDDRKDSDVSDSNPGVPSSEVARLGEWTTSRREIWCFYLYSIANNGLAGSRFAPSQFQNLLYSAGYDLSQPPFTKPCGRGSICVLPFMGRVRSINSIILLINGICFSFQAVMLLVIGAWADYGTWRPNILIFFTILSVGALFAWLGIQEPSKWPGAVVLYILTTISFQCCFTFWYAAIPGMVRNLPEVQASADEAKKGLKSSVFSRIYSVHRVTAQYSPEEHLRFESLARNRISNTSLAISSAAQVLILAIIIGILKALKSDATEENNTKAFNVILALCGGVLLLCAIPWFVFEKRRPGLVLPPGSSFATIGFKQTLFTLRECFRLKQTFLYLIYFFLMNDALSTTMTVVATLQNSVVSYSTSQLTLLSVVATISQSLGLYLLFLVQKKFGISTKRVTYPSVTDVTFNVFWILVLTIWGLLGVHTNKIGFKHVWEIWCIVYVSSLHTRSIKMERLYQVAFGVLIGPWYAFSQTMIFEVSPLPQMFLFFSLFSVFGRTSALIGPLVSEAIISASGNNNNMPFAFLFGLAAFGTVFVLWWTWRKAGLSVKSL